jgi:hypothetical protein
MMFMPEHIAWRITRAIARESKILENHLMTNHKKWMILSPTGLTLIGFGLSIVLEAARLKNAGEPWFWLGTLGLIVVNAGVACFGDGVKHRVLHELDQQARG